MNRVQLPRTIVNQILSHAQGSPDREICGLIGSADNLPAHCYPVANISGNQKHLFRMEPKGQVEAMKAMREAGEELFAIYHSHPDAPAQPSEQDVRDAEYPETVKLIVSLNTDGVLEMRGFRIIGGEVTELKLELET
ncbi:MAG: M67 family metallopeptidase [Gammaproteobacteria bacterium]|nr:M67 family metallopeptidase [Gammaproteobacteria bacterium]